MKKEKPGQFKTGNQAAVKHGAFSFLARGMWPPCSRCLFRNECDLALAGSHCRLFEAIEKERIAEIMQLDHIRPEHQPLVELYVRNNTVVRIIDLWLSKVSPFRGSGRKKSLDVQSVTKIRWVAENAATRQAAELLLTPASRERAGLPREPSALRPGTIVLGKDDDEESYVAKLRQAQDLLGMRRSEDPPPRLVLALPERTQKEEP